MTPGIKPLTNEVAQPVITFDWYCHTYHCKMLKATCDLRQQLAKHNGTNKYRAQYSNTCGNCSQIKKGVKMITEEVFTINTTEADNQESKACRNCREILPIENFCKNKECLGGREATCKKCRYEKKKLAEAFKKSEVRREKDGPSKGLPMLPKIKHTEPPRLPVGLLPGVTVKPVSGSNDSSITIDFSDYPDLLISISETAKREFRTPMMQILFMLSKFNDDR